MSTLYCYLKSNIAYASKQNINGVHEIHEVVHKEDIVDIRHELDKPNNKQVQFLPKVPNVNSGNQSY